MAGFDLIGNRFGSLQVTERVGRIGDKPAIHWRCVCDCGNTVLVKTGNLRNGSTNSCGCLRAKRMADMNHRHGQYGSRTYNSWKSMLQRCRDKNFRDYKRWGGRGITVCDRWLEFDNFLADMGERPIGASLDRIDNDGNYEPANCRWATPKQQANNRAKPRRHKKAVLS